MALTKVSTPAIKDEAITLAKLLHGDSNNDGKFLRANNGADPSFETVSIPAGTTINNNADNRIITGSGSANTLNGESKLIFDGSNLTLDAVVTVDRIINATDSADPWLKGVDSSNNETAYIKPNGQAYLSGNVGIGKSSPSDRLDVQTTHSSGGRIATFYNSDSGNNGGLIIQGGGSDGEARLQSAGGNSFLTFYTEGSDLAERLRIDSNGRLQQGSNPSNLGLARLNIVDANGHSINLSRNTGAAANNNERLGAIAFHPGLGSQSTTTGGASIEAFAEENQSGSTSATRLVFYTKPSGIGPGSTPIERFRLSSNGNLSWTGAGTQYVQFNNSGDVAVFQTSGTNNSNHGMIQFKDGGGTYCGQITSNGSNHTTSYVTNSDYRLKQNEASISDGITRLKQLKPYRFEWKTTGDKVDGFFAHEAQAVVPESVVGTKDEMQSIFYQEGDVLPEGKKVGDFKEYSTTEPKYQGIDQAKLVPLLTAALKEAIAKIEVLETKVAALEAA